MNLGLGVLGWAPSVFWGATMNELNRAWEGYAMAHGIDITNTGITEGDLNILMARFPDG